MLFATDYPGVNKGISMKPSINPEFRTVFFPEPAADVVKSASGARGPRRAEGLRMDARRAKTWRSLGLVYDSRTPKGASPKRIYLEPPSRQKVGISRRPREAGSASSQRHGLRESAPGC